MRLVPVTSSKYNIVIVNCESLKKECQVWLQGWYWEYVPSKHIWMHQGQRRHQNTWKTHMTLKAGTPVRAISPTVRSLLFPKCLQCIETYQRSISLSTMLRTLYAAFMYRQRQIYMSCKIYNTKTEYNYSTVVWMIYNSLLGQLSSRWIRLWLNSQWLWWTRRTAHTLSSYWSQRGLPTAWCHHYNNGRICSLVC